MKYLYLLLSIGLLCAQANAEVLWQVYIIKNNDRVNVERAEGVEVATATVRLNLPGVPVKAVVEPELRGSTPDGTPFVARMLAVEFLDGTGAAIGTICADLPRQGGVNSMLIRRNFVLYQVDLNCLSVPADPK